MRPAAGLDDPAAGEQFIEPGVAVGVDDAASTRASSTSAFASTCLA